MSRVQALLRLAAAGVVTLAQVSPAYAAFGQPAGERAAQRRLPQSRDPIWATLRTTRIFENDKLGIFTAAPPAAVRALAGRTVTVTGFMMPLEAQPQTTHFLLAKYTPVCFFCPPGEPNEVIEVHALRPLPAGYGRVRVTGRFGLQNNGEKGLFFRIDGAAAASLR